jgi:hypothetical protein
MSLSERQAVAEYLSRYVTPFMTDRLKPSVLDALIEEAEVVQVKANARPFTHRVD